MDNTTNVTTIYRGYTIETFGVSRYIFRPEGKKPTRIDESVCFSIADVAGYAQSDMAAKVWIDNDIINRAIGRVIDSY